MPLLCKRNTKLLKFRVGFLSKLTKGCTSISLNNSFHSPWTAKELMWLLILSQRLEVRVIGSRKLGKV